MEKTFIRFANRTARVAGSPWAFVACVAIVVIWAVSGPVFHYSETWQLIINTGTTIITFLMVFLIQNTQNRDAAAMHAKLDELVYGGAGCDNCFIGIEHLTEKELEAILEEVEKRALEIHAERRRRSKGGDGHPRRTAANTPSGAKEDGKAQGKTGTSSAPRKPPSKKAGG